MGVIEVAQELYAVPPTAFTAQRNATAAALRATDREQAAQVRALPRPSVAAWVVNDLVRSRPEVIRAAIALGSRLAAAQDAFDGAALRTLAKEQQSLLADLRRQVGEVAERSGQSLSAPTAGQVEGTVRAAMADPAAARAVASGVLVRDLHSTGLEPVDLTGALAVEDAPALLDIPEPATHPVPAEPVPGEPVPGEPAPGDRLDAGPGPDDSTSAGGGSTARAPRDEAAQQEAAERAAQRERARRAQAQARDHLASAEQVVREAVRSQQAAETAETALAERAASLAEEVDEATRRLEALRAALTTVQQDQRGARQARQDAVRVTRAAERARTQAERTLERLDVPPD